MSLSAMMTRRLRRVEPIATAGVEDTELEGTPAVPAGGDSGAARQVADYVDQVARYIPTELITAYVAVSGWQLQNTVSDRAKWITFFGFCAATPAVAWVVYALWCKAARLPLPSHPRSWPWWKMIAAMMAFTVWAMVLPSGPAVNYEFFKKGLAGVILVVFSLAMGLIAKLFEPST